MGIDLVEIRERTREYFDAVGLRYFELFQDELTQKPYDRKLLKRFAGLVGRGGTVCDAGCGPCGHVTRFLADQGLDLIGVDLAVRCIDLARAAQPALTFRVMDMMRMDFETGSLEGLVAYYSILYTPKVHLPMLFQEFHRVLKPGGKVLVVVKEGEGEGWIDDPMGSGVRTFFASFKATELKTILEASGFRCLFSGLREPYAFEFPVKRIAMIAEKAAAQDSMPPWTPVR